MGSFLAGVFPHSLGVLVASTVFACGFGTGAADQGKNRTSNTEWRGYNGGYDATRFSSLTQINRTNVASLQEIARFRIPETTNFQTDPVVIGDTMYVTTLTNTYAIDARTGRQRWVHHFEPESMAGSPVRGVGYADGRIFRGAPDGRLLALDAEMGDLVWNVEGADPSAGEYFTMAPVVWEGLVFIGNSGGDVGAIGHVRAFDAKSGRRLWNFDTVPSSGEASKTWPADPNKVKVGGCMYTSFALDPESGMLYVPVGNPGPDFAGDYRNGDNLYTGSVILLDAKSGVLKGYHQFIKHDVHDWDCAASPILFTSRSGRKMVAAACKNGYLYGVSRDLAHVLYQTPVTRIENVNAPLTPQGTRFLPGTIGGTNWYGPSYSPPLNALFVPSIDWATTIKLGGAESLRHNPPRPFIGSSNMFGDQDPKSERFGHITAVNAENGKVLWRYDTDTPMAASVTPTAGGVLLTADTKGNFLALDATDGKVLLQKNLGDPIGGGVVTYMRAGTQYVAVAGGMKNAIAYTDSGPAWVSILALPQSSHP